MHLCAVESGQINGRFELVVFLHFFLSIIPTELLVGGIFLDSNSIYFSYLLLLLGSLFHALEQKLNGRCCWKA